MAGRGELVDALTLGHGDERLPNVVGTQIRRLDPIAVYHVEEAPAHNCHRLAADLPGQPRLLHLIRGRRQVQ
jgi:hypothetical protein